MIYPFVRPELDILFVGLNPANTSSRKGHYFSTNSAFWNQLYESGLITEDLDKNIADTKVFGSTIANTNHWKYGITDLVNFVAESNSSIVKPTLKDCEDLEQTIVKNKPKIVVILHSKVIKWFINKHIGKRIEKNGNIGKLNGNIGKLIEGCDTIFYTVPFPHGNSIPSESKIKLYKEIKTTLESWNSTTF